MKSPGREQSLRTKPETASSAVGVAPDARAQSERSPAPSTRHRDARHIRELVLHLAKRELSSKHRWTVLGWAWPLTRQLIQLGILVFVFSTIFDFGIENYPVFIFTGLIAFSWFSAGLSDSASALLSQRHLVFQPGLPSVVLPVVAVAVPFVDVLMAAPVLVGMLVVGGTLHWTALLLPVLVLIQLVLMCGLGWLTAAATVYLRDVPHIVGVALTMLFYVTPVFYPLSRVPERFHSLLRVNPLTTLIEGYRDLLIEGRVPGLLELATVAVAALVLAALGLALFKRLEPGFVDEL